MNKFKFATIAVGEKYNKRLLDTLFMFDKMGYDKNDTLIIYTDKPNLYDLNLNINVEVFHFNESNKFKKINESNFRDNTLIKLFFIGNVIYNNGKKIEHNVITWFDADAFPIIPKHEVVNEIYEPGFYFRDCHLFDSFDELNQSLKERFERYSLSSRVIAKCGDKLAAPVETILTIVPNSTITSVSFLVEAINLVDYNLHSHLNNCYSESAELSFCIGKSFKECKPVGRSICTDNHIMPHDSVEQDRDKLMNNNFIREHFTSNN